METYKDEYKRQKDIHISENKANLVKRKNVKSNFKALNVTKLAE